MTNPVTYNCPHCRSPFSVIPTAQSQVVSCPSCRGRVTIGPQQPAPPPTTPAPVPPPQQPMQPQYQQQYPQQPYQQQYQQQPYQQQYQQPMAPQPTPPPKKSKKGLVIAVVLVVVILIVAALAYLFVFAAEEGSKKYSATYAEFLNDMDINTMKFKTYDDGDIVDITGTVDKVKLADVPAGAAGADSGTWTIVYFEPPSPSAIVMYDCFAYKGDKSDEYTVGQEGTVRVHIKKMSALGITVEYPEECVQAESIEDYIQVPTAALSFTETSPGTGNYTGSIVSASDTIYLSDIEIVIYDDSTGISGSDDGDLTDDDPEEVDVWYGNLKLEYTDVNTNDKLDAADVIKIYDADSGDKVTIRDYDSYDDIASYTIS